MSIERIISAKFNEQTLCWEARCQHCQELVMQLTYEAARVMPRDNFVLVVLTPYPHTCGK